MAFGDAKTTFTSSTKPKPKAKPIKQTTQQLASSVASPSGPNTIIPKAQVAVGGANNVANPSLASLGTVYKSPTITPALGAVQAASGSGGVTPAAGAVTVNGGAQNWNQGTTDPLTGFLAQFGYTPQGASQLYDNPMPLAADVLGQRGITNAGMANSLSQYMDPAIAANFILGQGMGSSQSDNAALNFAANYMNQMVTPGGRTPEFDVLMNKILGAGNSTSSPLAEYLSSGQMTPEQQVQAANALMSQTLGGISPYGQRAYSNAEKDFGQAYQGGVMKGNPQGISYVDYLKHNTPLGSWANR